MAAPIKKVATWNNQNTTWHEILKKFPEEEKYMKILGPAKDFPILHDAIGKVPLKDIEFLIEKIRVDLALRDDNGKNALMVALSKASEYDIKFWPEYFKPTIELILRNARPTANNTANILKDETGRHLLHISADMGLSWELVQVLCKEDSSALGQADELTGVWPFMLAARGDGGKSDLTTSFELLRTRPHAIDNVEKKYGKAAS